MSQQPDLTPELIERLKEVRHWHSLFEVSFDDSTRSELIAAGGKVAVFRHTLDDYTFLLGLVDALQAEIERLRAVLVLAAIPLERFEESK